jgi:release factor glutamine methyltransferase
MQAMKICDALRWGTEELRLLEHPSLEAEVLLSHVLREERIFFKTHPEKKVSWWSFLLYKKCVQQRKKHVPVAYIVGYKNWGGMRILVNKNVLIPRDETEILCEHIVAEKRNISPKCILDVGTGSGCIALSLARAFPLAQVTALDNSSKALTVARKNFSNPDFVGNRYICSLPRIRTVQSNLLEKIHTDSTFDLIVANLPYVPETLAVSPEVEKEPSEALFSGSDGLDLIRKFATQLTEKNIRFVELWLEFLPSQQKEIGGIFADYKVSFFTDSGGSIFFARVNQNF